MKKKGFTLIEVLLSLAILSISIVAIFNMVFSIVKNTKLNTEKQQARFIAQETVEQIRALDSVENTFLYNGVKIEDGKINGVVNSFIIEGTIVFNPDKNDENNAVLNNPINLIIDLKKAGYIYRESESIKDYLLNSSLTSRTNISSLKLKLDDSYIYINDKQVGAVTPKYPLVIIIREDLSDDPIKISIENKNDSKINMYMVTDEDIDVGNSYKITKIDGKVSVYNSKIYPHKKLEGIYSISMKIKKNNIVLQTVNAQKTIK